MQVKIDALDITVLKGGGEAVGRWATEHGFRLPPDAPEVLDFYAARSPIFLAADLRRRRREGEGPEHRRRHAGPHHDADREPLGPAAHPRHRQERRRPHRSGRVPADRPQARRCSPRRSRTACSSSTARRLRPRCSTTFVPTRAWSWVPEMGWLTKIAHRRLGQPAHVRPRGQRERHRAIACRRRPRSSRDTNERSRSSARTSRCSLAGIAILGLGALLLIARFAPRTVKRVMRLLVALALAAFAASACAQAQAATTADRGRHPHPLLALRAEPDRGPGERADHLHDRERRPDRPRVADRRLGLPQPPPHRHRAGARRPRPTRSRPRRCGAGPRR